jgi:hypothetical protein
VVIGRFAVPAPQPAGQAQVAALRQEVGVMRQMLTMSLLQQQSAAERLEGVAWTGRLEAPGAEVVSALIDTLRADSSVNVRLAAIDALRRFADREPVRRSALDLLPRQSSPLVQIALIDFVLEVDAGDSAPLLRRLAQDPMTADAVRMHAARRLEQLGAQS